MINRSVIVSPSVPAELAWILNLVVQTAPYRGPALEELDQALVPGIGRLASSLRDRFRRLWADAVPGCPELILVAHGGGCLLDADEHRLFACLRSDAEQPVPDLELLGEPEAARPAIRLRVERLGRDRSVRHAYLELLSEIWRLAGNAWQQTGLAVVTQACTAWRDRLGTGVALEDLVAPRHPLTRAGDGTDDFLTRERNVVVSPLYFCTSGGHVVDLGEYVHVGVAASDLLPIRRGRDAAFVAARLRVLAETTRVHVLIQLLSAPSGVMDLARALRISQPTVSGHVRVLERAGLIQLRRLGSRRVYVASRKRVERLLEDARGTLARWD